jgi:hypothetical protein
MKRALRIAIFLPIFVFLGVLLTLVHPLYRFLRWLDDEPIGEGDHVKDIWGELMRSAVQ